GEEASGEPGIGFAFLMSIIYAAVGGWLGSTWEAKLEEEKLQEKPETTKKTGGGKQ
ncbi:MAG: hypothetical protein GWO20_09185, partial [Candidatus Korarchaeota archaeon]|nr:hypothetical protein [Candidatus Korarchaeota archaeon]NIU83579.1 hypothetical protein [Candidatus Thorarchaeota archaeon]NIW13834.1 hypothetical protein [Candidatus Thorarchaeota archaeon]NIW51951.1 hypothetical protein [Candidatus Korarchaeota archaeon]